MQRDQIKVCNFPLELTIEVIEPSVKQNRMRHSKVTVEIYRKWGNEETRKYGTPPQPLTRM